MLRSQTAVLKAAERLQASDFSTAAHREIFADMMSINFSNRRVDLTTLDAELTKRGKLEAIGGASYLVELTKVVPSAVGVDTYIDTVLEAANNRRLQKIAEAINKAVSSGERTSNSIIESIDEACNDITTRSEKQGSGWLTGADAVLLVTPYYNKATQDGLYAHYRTIASATKLPCIVYNVPSRTGTNILPETMARLARDQENIAAIKEASGNISQVAKLSMLLDGHADIYSGNDDQIVPICSLGGIGVISVLSNVAPKKTHDMVMRCLEGKYEEARKMQLEALPLVEQLFIEVNPIPVKAALNMQGFEVGDPRLPLTRMTQAHQETLRSAMQAYGCL